MSRADITLPETALVTTWCRANEARRHDRIIDDPMAIRLIDSIDYDFNRFKHTQEFALRALAFDNNTHRYLSQHPEATVVALGEGLQTSFWRLDAAGLGGGFRWLSVDLPPNIEFRERLLPQSPRISMCAQSVLDFSWMDRVNPQNGVFVTAEGLLPYLQPEEALGLIRECARRFPGGQMMFDLSAKLNTALTNRGLPTSQQGRWPRTPFSLSVSELASLMNSEPDVRMVHNLPLPRSRGSVTNLLSKAQRLPVYEPLLWLAGGKWPSVATLTLLEFGS